MSSALDQKITELVGKSGEKVRIAAQKWNKEELSKDRWGILRPENCTKIMQELRSLLAKTMVSAIRMKKGLPASAKLPSPRIGRIIVHGVLPHLIWSRSEAYRPVYFFDSSSGIHAKCRACVKKRRCQKLEEGALDPRILLPHNWKAAIDALVPSGEVPICWSRTFLIAPDLCRCQYIRNAPRPVPKFGKWTLQDILALSRLRLKPYALKKRAIVRTPGLSKSENENLISILSPSYFNDRSSDGHLSDIVSVTRDAQRAVTAFLNNPNPTTINEYEQYMRTYIQTFESDKWEETRVWKSEAKTMPTMAGSGDPASIRASLKEPAAFRANEFWVGIRDDQDKDLPKKWFHKIGFSLNTELCALLTGTEDEDPPLQAIYGCRTLDDHICVYFEFEWPGAGGTAIEEETPKTNTNDERIGKLDLPIENAGIESPLSQFCHRVLAPWQTAMRSADARWENHRTFSHVFSGQTRQTLIDSPDEVEKALKKLTDSPSRTSLDRLSLVKALYMDRANREEDNPVNLALSTMGDAWKFALRGILNPQYGHFQRFQQLLKSMPNYRDHLTHSIQVYLLGEKILDAFSTQHDLKENLPRIHNRHSKLALDAAALKRMAPAILRFQWALTSLMHDFACPAEKVNEVVSNLFKTFIGIKGKGSSGTSALRDLIDSDQRKYRTFLYGLLSKTQMGSLVLHGSHEGVRAEVNADYALPALSEFTYEALAEDHGFLSAVYLFNQLFEESPSCWRLRSTVARWMFRELFQIDDSISNAEIGKGSDSAYWRLAECLILEVLDAIIKHNATAKEYRLFFGDSPAYKKPSVYFSAADSIFGSALPGLLLLCDTLCDSGRIIHPDELARYDVRDGALQESAMNRPEGQIALDTKNGRCRIAVNYEWPLPPEYGKASGGCLRETYFALRQELLPYTPEFSLPKVCAECERPNWSSPKADGPPCPAVQELERFWAEVLTGTASGVNRLAFPHKYYDDTFNSIEIDIQFQNVMQRNGSVGSGFKPRIGLVSPRP